MKKILVPTDFSIQASYALDAALCIARKGSAEVHLHHIIEAPEYPEITDIIAYQKAFGNNNILDAIESRLDEIASDERCQGVTVSWSVALSSPYEKIAAKAESDCFDLIVMGSHGRQGRQKLMLGSTTDKVIQHASPLVLVIKEPTSCFAPTDIVFGSNFYGEIAEGFSALKRFAEIYDATVHLLKVNTRSHFETTRYSRQLMEQFAEEQQLANHTINIYNDDSEEEGILHFAQDIQAGMICVPTHGNTGISHLLYGSVAESVSDQAFMPVMTYKIKPVHIRYGVIGPFS